MQKINLKKDIQRNPWVIASSIITLVAFAIIGVYSFKPKSVDINIINSVPYGSVEVEGLVQKDSPAGKTGSYFVILSDGSYAELDSTNLDSFISKLVRITGTLSPSTIDQQTKILLVETISAI